MAYPLTMRIGLDARMAYYSSAGLGRYIQGLLGGLVSIDGQNRYTVFRSRKEPGGCPLPPNFYVRPLWTPCHHPWEQLALPLELAFSRLDVLHSPDFIPPLRRRCRSVVTVHDLAFLRYPQFLTPQARCYYGQIGPAVESAQAIVAVSQHTKQDLMELLGVPGEKVHVVYEAPDPLFRPLDGQPGGAPPRLQALPRPFLLFVGTLEPRKNLATLLQALSQVKARLGPATPHLVLAGRKGWLYQETLDLIGQLGLGEEVGLFGPASPQELLWLYNLAEMMVLPSLYEGFGLPLVEAMACGTPVVASRTSSLPEVAGEAAVLVEPLDSQAWAGAICQVLEDPNLRATLRQRGLQRAASFDWASAARATLDVYQKVASG